MEDCLMKDDAIILDGRKVANELYSKLPNMNGKELAIITIGEDEASKIYVRNKIKACEKVGLKGINYRFSANIESKEIINLIFNKLNPSDNIIGIMIQQPYPNKFKSCCLENLITIEKDIEGLSEYNMCQTLLGKIPTYYPATPKGIITLLDYYNIPIEGKNVVIIGRSEIVGKPLAAMMLARNATVTVCHSKTSNLNSFIQNANIIVSAVGQPKFITSERFINGFVDTPKTGPIYTHSYNMPVIIDVGINRDENSKLCGDVDFNDVLPYVSAITPVPGGVGPLTVYSLIENCCKNYK